MLNKQLAFIKKEFLTESSYKVSFLLNIFAVLVSLLSFYFIDKLFGRRIAPSLEEFGVGYFPYVLVGMALFSYLGFGMSSFTNRIQQEQTQGTLEAILLTPTKISTILISLSLWNLIFATLDTAMYIILGVLVFKINFSGANIPVILIILGLTILSFSSLGILSASFIMIFKRGDPLGWVINNLEGLICGVYFPVTVLPLWMQYLAKFFPITYAIRAIELATHKGYSLFQLRKEILFLAIFSCLFLPFSLYIFSQAVKKAKLTGSLGQY